METRTNFLTELRCRVCLSNNSELIPLQESTVIHGKVLSLSEIFVNCTSVQLSYDDRKPQNICIPCSENAKISYKFKIDCENSDKILQKEIKEEDIAKFKKIELSFTLDSNFENINHYDDAIESVIPNSDLKNKIKEKYNCSKCNTKFKSDIELQKHMASHTFKNNLQSSEVPSTAHKTCELCGKIFTNRTNMLKHKKTHGTIKKTCEYCPFIPKAPSKLAKHMEEEHSYLKTVICAICGKRFFKKANLRFHMITHSGVKRHTCEICGLSFALSGNLSAHKRLHSGEKPYTCSECGKGFTQQATLRSHEAVHSDKREHVCPECGAAFSRAGALRNHRKRHTNSRPFVCPMSMCCKSFAFSSERKRHMAIHTGIKKHECDVCGKRFNRNSNLKVHTRIHTGETPHTCYICDKGFIQAHCLRTHLNTHNIPLMV